MCTAFIYNQKRIETQKDLSEILGGPNQIPFRNKDDSYVPDQCLCCVNPFIVAKILKRKMGNDGLDYILDPFTPDDFCWLEYDPETKN